MQNQPDSEKTQEDTSSSSRQTLLESISTTQRNMGTQTQPEHVGFVANDEYEALNREYVSLSDTMKVLNKRIQELENSLKEKDDLISAFKSVQPSGSDEERTSAAFDDLQEAHQV